MELTVLPLMASIVFSLEDGTTFTTALDGDSLTIGRHPDNVAQLLSPSVSNRHATLELRDDGWYVQDLSSRNGTRVNGAEIEESRLNDGDRVSFGDVQALFYAADAPPVVKEEEPADPRPAPVVQAPAKLVAESYPATGIPPGAGIYAPPQRLSPMRRQAEEGNGCMTAFILTILFVGAFLLGLTLRHYQQTNGGFLPNDLIDKLFSKAGKLHIESGDK